MRNMACEFIWTNIDSKEQVDFRTQSFPTANALEAIRNAIVPRTETFSNRVEVDYCILNRGAERGTILALPGHGGTATNHTGIRNVCLIAACNPEHEIVWAEGLRHVPRPDRVAGSHGNLGPYTNHYVRFLEKNRLHPSILAGRSTGARMQAHLSNHGYLEQLVALSLSEPPGAKRFWLPVANFAIGQATLVENVRSWRKGYRSDYESILNEAVPPGSQISYSEATPESIVESLIKLRAGADGLAKLGLEEALTTLLLNRPRTRVTLWQGTETTAVPPAFTYAMFRRLQAMASEQLTFMVAKTAHVTQADPARLGRQIHYVTAMSMARTLVA